MDSLGTVLRVGDEVKDASGGRSKVLKLIPETGQVLVRSQSGMLTPVSTESLLRLGSPPAHPPTPTITTGPPADPFVRRISDQVAKDRKPITHAETYHATDVPDLVRKHGLKVGDGRNGAFFGKGIYLNTDKQAADRYLAGVLAYQSDNVVQVKVQARVVKPFVVHARGDDHDPGVVMRRALTQGGIIKLGEKPTPAQITKMLRDRGYDGVEVRQPEFNDEIGGSQLVVFDQADVEVIR